MSKETFGTVDLSDIPNMDPGHHKPSFTDLSVKERINAFMDLFDINVESDEAINTAYKLAHRYVENGVLQMDALGTLATAIAHPKRDTAVEKFRGMEKAFSIETRLKETTPDRQRWQQFLKSEAPNLADEIWRSFMKKGKLVYDIEPSKMHIGYDRRTGVLTLAGLYGAANIRLENQRAVWA